MPTPSRASRTSSRCTSALVAMSMPRVGSSTISSAGWRPSHLASTTFCWLPPDSRDTGSVSRPYLMFSRTAQSAANARSAARPDQAALAQPAERGERHVLLHRHVHDQALLPAVLGDEADPGGHRGRRRGAAQLAAAHHDPAGVVAVDAEHGPGHLAAARPDQAGQGDDLARPARQARCR